MRNKNMDVKHCAGCYNNFYNQGDKCCWNLKSAKLVWRIPIGVDERPPYKNKKAKRVPSCWRGGGSNRTIMIKKEALTKDGYWKSF